MADYLRRAQYRLIMRAYADPEKRKGTPEWGYTQYTSPYDLGNTYQDLRAEMEMRGLHELREVARRHGYYLARVEWEWLLLDQDLHIVDPQPLPPGVAVITSNLPDGNAPRTAESPAGTSS